MNLIEKAVKRWRRVELPTLTPIPIKEFRVQQLEQRIRALEVLVSTQDRVIRRLRQRETLHLKILEAYFAKDKASVVTTEASLGIAAEEAV